MKIASKGKGSPWARAPYDLFAPVRKSLKGRSEREINEAISAAVKKVRSGKRRSR